MRSLNLVFNRSKCRGRARFVCCCVILRRCMALLVGCGVALLPARPVDLRARGEGVVEYPGKVACPSGRRCSTRNAVWCHSHPGFKSQRYRHCRPAPMGPGGFVMPTRRAWVACDAAGGPGCFVCPWAAARPRAVRAASFAWRVASKPGQALPPPIYFARNSPEACSNIEFTSLELQRFRMVSKSDRRKLCATFGQCGLCCRLRVLGSDSPAIHALVIPEAVGVLHYTKPAGGVSPACRTLV